MIKMYSIVSILQPEPNKLVPANMIVSGEDLTADKALETFESDLSEALKHEIHGTRSFLEIDLNFMKKGE